MQVQKKTQQTAEIISRHLHLSVTIDERLVERMDWGEMPGESFEEFLKEWSKTQLDRKYIPTHGDSSFATGERVTSVLKDFAQDNQSILIVTHGGAIGDFLMNNFSREEFSIAIDPATNAEYIEIKECSITEVENHADTFVLKKANDTSHLSPHGI